ncbi:MAG: hypothetical protein NTY11_00335 [Candidatus Parcubacteria bacterium]|nr:hypothetical protein [Candidatus Parcubacteria bacterium]
MNKDKDLSTVILGGVSAFLLAILLYQNFVPGAYTFNGGSATAGAMSKEDAANKTITYIQDNLASPGTEFTLKGSEEKSGVYEVSFDVMGQSEKVYVTKDGKILFLNSFDMNPPAEKTLTKTDKPTVELFVMSFCPYGNQAEGLMKPVADLLGDKADIQLHYIFYTKDQGYTYPDSCYDEAGQYCSMHGIQELHQDVRELCVQKYQPDKLWGFVKAINDQATAQNVDSKWEAIANSNGIKETSKIAGSPMIVINGIIYDGARTSEGYKEAICSTFNNAPSECQQAITTDTSTSTTNPGSCQ